MAKGNDAFGRIKYVQSANALFHFMKKWDYLKSALNNRGLVPRYCKEDISYLGIKDGNDDYVNEIGVLEKCFCDIPLHEFNKSFPIKIKDGVISEEDREDVKSYNTHPGFYGNYAIAFEKSWCEENDCQPVYYLNTKSITVKNLRTFINKQLQEGRIDNIGEDLALRLSLVKPLKGEMARTLKWGSTVEFEKNYHDEKEWRYVMRSDSLKDLNIDRIIRINSEDELESRNNELYDDKYKKIWLNFKYIDIRYLIVPGKVERNECIEYILQLPDNLFEDGADVARQKSLLISKILVLEDIEEDC
ncbi:MAG: hypothetical protein IJ682_04320 [Lachnospiraceae bacterium]|nr:hypothetical protein [Lachnospiraceae bacterium]